MAFTAKDVAEWMAQQLHENGELYQLDAAAEIESRFGEEFVYVNNNGNPAISKDVLKEFTTLTKDAVWIRSERYWREREPGDEPGRNQTY